MNTYMAPSMPKESQELIDDIASSVALAAQLDRAKRHSTGSNATDRRREQCRVSQRSFRERKKKEHEGIETTVQSLEEEVQRLEVQKAQLVRCVPLSTILVHQPDFDGGVPTKLVRKYISVFKSGYIPSKRRMSERQEKFIRAIAHEHINYNGSIGVHSILANWERYTNSFASVNMEALSCDVMKTDDGAIVRGVTKSTLKMNRQSINLFFPNCPDCLKPSLIGQNLVVIATMHWSFDEHDVLTLLSGRADFTNGLLALLRNPDDVEAVLARSRIIPPVVTHAPPASLNATDTTSFKMHVDFQS
ncbi:hypothetical protein H257_00570 [Aphanomyces astaci]|uniref:BZIP domain-containing protein n=1 Tax=Aphanomyces astaci TaxID=112090 RepID=W4HC97_APHAT|nr:hypothetical protein H257_00570 [Aphanomyces astaci]ETV89211.1 hypothetical protein H257_00570 [Aphanomyces astaci]|eukprot:XP_009821611.1 hypothetical protein H257_00570 [Aphanomyces astaci]